MLKRKFAENLDKPLLNYTNDSDANDSAFACRAKVLLAGYFHFTCIDWHVTSFDHLSRTLSLEREEERDSRDDVVTLSSRSDQYQISPHNIRA